MAEQYARIQTDADRVLIARAKFGGLPASEAITHLAVGAGAVVLNGNGILQKPLSSGTVTQELGRVRYAEKHYVVADPAGQLVADARYSISVDPTNKIYFRFTFLETQAQGAWRQYGLFAGGVSYLERGATLIDIGGLAGDDRANAQVLLIGAYSPAQSQRITVTCTTGGASGVAKIGWVSNGSVAPGSNVTVLFGTPVPIPGSGLNLTFTGGGDNVLTNGTQWEIRGTRSADTATFAAGGVYDAIANQAGQVLDGGDCVELIHRSPAFDKVGAAIDVILVHEVLKNA